MHFVALGNAQAPAAGDEEQKPERVRTSSVHVHVDGKQFGGPGRSVPPKRFCSQLARSSRNIAVILPRGLLRANGHPAVRPPTKLSQRERTKATWPPPKTGAVFF